MDKNNILNLAIQSHKEKKITKAISLYKKVIASNPKSSKAIYNLALLYLQSNDHKNSLKFFFKFIKLNPKNSDAYNDIGLIYYQNKELDKALDNISKSLELNPYNGNANKNLGLIYYNLKQYSEAEKYLTRAFKLNPKSYETYLNLKKIYKINDKFENLENLYLRTIALNPNYINAYIDIMDLYERKNEEKKLTNIIKKTETVFDEHNFVNLFKGKIFFKKNNFDQVISLLEPLTFKQETLEQSKCMILAKSFDKKNNIEKAFYYFSKMNKISLRNKNKNIDKNNFITLIDKRINFFKKNRVKNWPECNINVNYNDPVFMIGFPRSGTTLLDTILRGHPKVEVIEEKPIIYNVLENLQKITKGNFSNLYKLKTKDILSLREVYFHQRLQYTKKNEKGKIYIDKFPLNIIYTAEIIRIFPDAKFIFSLRNPYDCILSCFMQDFYLNDAMSNFLDINDCSFLYNKVMKLWSQYFEIFQFDKHFIKYEDLVTNFDNSLNKVLEFLNLDWSDEITNYQNTAKKRNIISTPSYNQVIKPIYKEAINRWIRYENKLQGIKPLIDPWVKKYNYF